MGQLNPWTSMWSHPRVTIHFLSQNKPRYGVFLLSTLYAVQALLYFANYWSLGFSFPFPVLLGVSVLAAPFAGFAWVYLMGWLLSMIGRCLGGSASQEMMRLAASWSKLPTVITLLMWFLLLISSPGAAFLQASGGETMLFVNCISLIVFSWSFVLLIQSIRELEGFSCLRSLSLLLLSLASYYTVLFFIFMIVRFIYIKLY